MLPSWSEPRATSAIAEIRKFIGQVLTSGHAYEVDGSVYFEVATFKIWLIEWARPNNHVGVSGGAWRQSRRSQKRDPLDFVLWQPSADDEPSWESRWGYGRPVWHIECSVLAMRDLGTATIDLHGGGAI